MNDFEKYLKEVSQREKKATIGPWQVREDYDYYQSGTYLGFGPLRYLQKGEEGCKNPWTKVECSIADVQYFKQDVCRIETGLSDVQFIANARTDVPKLKEIAAYLYAEIESSRINWTEIERIQNTVSLIAKREIYE